MQRTVGNNSVKTRIIKRHTDGVALHILCIHAIRKAKPDYDNAVYLYTLKKEAEGKPVKVAKIAGLNKLLRLYYARVMEAYTR